MNETTKTPTCPTCKGLGVINPFVSRSLHPTAIFGTPCPAKCGASLNLKTRKS